VDAGNPLAFEFPLWHNLRIPCIRPIVDNGPTVIQDVTHWMRLPELPQGGVVV
jgi:hypothetical protein